MTGEAAKTVAKGARAENECKVSRERLTKKADDAQCGALTRQHIASSLTLMIINQKGLSGNEATFRQLQAADSLHYLQNPAMNYSAVSYKKAQRGCCGNQKKLTLIIQLLPTGSCWLISHVIILSSRRGKLGGPWFGGESVISKNSFSTVFLSVGFPASADDTLSGAPAVVTIRGSSILFNHLKKLKSQSHWNQMCFRFASEFHIRS